ncbi:hypothetical protein KIL84_006001 [Mauremys mutica]|uniref:Uncharacterized protein n=1 Tax=Mauremys mutica TaxID=74926 RepID=A0A9D3XHR2_9SAUR|nr:hypothetical protein KIL84_006001 [Mauremys mutica]
MFLVGGGVLSQMFPPGQDAETEDPRAACSVTEKSWIQTGLAKVLEAGTVNPKVRKQSPQSRLIQNPHSQPQGGWGSMWPAQSSRNRENGTKTAQISARKASVA